ncbi:MAG: hypothetical protein KH501_01240 [Eubacterium limosum]|nr:hypothetical protein [Eubacterium limosum]
MKKVYLRIYENRFSLICDSILEEGDNTEEITNSDILVTNADYELYREGIATGKVFRLKTEIPADGGLFDFIEEYTPDPPGPTETELLKEQVAMLDGALNEVLFTILPEMQGGEI